MASRNLIVYTAIAVICKLDGQFFTDAFTGREPVSYEKTRKIRFPHHERALNRERRLSRLQELKLSDNGFDELSSTHNPSSRRFFLDNSWNFILASVAAVNTPTAVHAKYGEGTSMDFPSYIDYLIEKNTAADNSKALYTGADPATVLRRLAEAEGRLGEIGELAEQKKWSQINGIITGPLGTLSSSMSQIVTISSSSPSTTQKKTKQIQDIVKKVKADVFAIGQAASRKDANECTKQSVMASSDLKSLLEIAFE